MAERIRRFDPLVRVERETVLKEVDKMVQVPSLGVVHPSRGGHEPRPQVACGFHHSHGPNGSL